MQGSCAEKLFRTSEDLFRTSKGASDDVWVHQVCT